MGPPPKMPYTWAYLNKSEGYSLQNYTINQTGMYYDVLNMPPGNVLGDYMMYQGMWRDWLAACFAGSLCLFFGALWLYKEMILLAFILGMVFLPVWTSAMIYVIYNQPNNNVFTTWWYAAVCMW